MPGKPAGRDWHWDRYWRFNRVASCYDRPGANYPPAFAREWDAFFARIPAGANLLDVCTGNGAIARFAARHALETGKAFHVTAVDRAAIDPLAFAPEPAIAKVVEFRSNVLAEKLPFPDSSFDAAMSQYGLEYTDHERALKELGRVVKPGAPAKIICHAKEGVPFRDAEKDLARIALVVDELSLFEIARRALRVAWDAGQRGNDASFDVAPVVAELQAALTRLERIKAADPSPFFDAAHGLVKHTFEVRAHFPLPVLLDKIEETELEALAHRERLLALQRSALSEEDGERWLRQAKASGFDAEPPSPFRVGPGLDLAGWIFQLRYVA